MSKYRVKLTYTYEVEVQADNEDAAITAARDLHDSELEIIDVRVDGVTFIREKPNLTPAQVADELRYSSSYYFDGPPWTTEHEELLHRAADLIDSLSIKESK